MLKCPKCGDDVSPKKVIDSREAARIRDWDIDGMNLPVVRRRRQCKCRFRWTSYEIPAMCFDRIARKCRTHDRIMKLVGVDGR